MNFRILRKTEEKLIIYKRRLTNFTMPFFFHTRHLNLYLLSLPWTLRLLRGHLTKFGRRKPALRRVFFVNSFEKKIDKFCYDSCPHSFSPFANGGKDYFF